MTEQMGLFTVHARNRYEIDHIAEAKRVLASGGMTDVVYDIWTGNLPVDAIRAKFKAGAYGGVKASTIKKMLKFARP